MRETSHRPLAGRTALITGSLAGLGYAIGAALAAQGATVVLNGLCAPGEGEAAAARLALDQGGTVVFDAADLRKVSDIEAMARGAITRFGGVDILVNNAVVRHFAAVEDFATQDWDDEIAVNLSAAFHLARLCLPGMKAQGWGRVINLASVFGARGAANRIGYVTTKTALTGMTRAIAIETARTGVTCNAISPGTVPSPAILDRIAATAEKEGRSKEEVAEDYVSVRHPTGRFVALESVGALAAFLCSPAGADITGATLPVDAGWLAG
ncbi:MAG: SDR family oxidoreductase [Rhodospirillum sp.]|nr:SDR family oxidoreductase [Rhodospirillum sp.]MCF8488572.1 SDR family oxidoreductase [Rhodospirillum sp.]MCF8499168.1 SDR family oxidoreductase [Rhodospirillum sp.]